MISSFNKTDPGIGDAVFIAGSADVIGRVRISDDASIWHGAVIRGDVNDIIIGERTNIQDMTVIHCGHEDYAKTVIGANVTVGHSVVLHGCRIGDAVLVGMGAIILDGAVIGDESIVAAGSLVTKGRVFPKRSLIMGSPAEVKRTLVEEEIRTLYESAEGYVTLKNIYLKG
jgi:carbonic anhydrase/acetyltransferase-like protein (isoleucine patch superfamily)